MVVDWWGFGRLGFIGNIKQFHVLENIVDILGPYPVRSDCKYSENLKTLKKKE